MRWKQIKASEINADRSYKKAFIKHFQTAWNRKKVLFRAKRIVSLTRGSSSVECIVCIPSTFNGSLHYPADRLINRLRLIKRAVLFEKNFLKTKSFNQSRRKIQSLNGFIEKTRGDLSWDSQVLRAVDWLGGVRPTELWEHTLQVHSKLRSSGFQFPTGLTPLSLTALAVGTSHFQILSHWQADILTEFEGNFSKRLTNSVTEIQKNWNSMTEF